MTLPRLEFEATRMNEPFLRQVAAVTGGEFLTLDRIGELPKLLPKREQLLVNEQTQDLLGHAAGAVHVLRAALHGMGDNGNGKTWHDAKSNQYSVISGLTGFRFTSTILITQLAPNAP